MLINEGVESGDEFFWFPLTFLFEENTKEMLSKF